MIKKDCFVLRTTPFFPIVRSLFVVCEELGLIFISSPKTDLKRLFQNSFAFFTIVMNI
jgi:hypothetical protein